MDKTRNMLAWLGEGEERYILDDALAHIKKSLECVQEMKNSVEAFVQNDQKKKDESILNLKAAERAGDEMRRKIMENLSRGLLLPPDREDLMFLNEKLNDIADNAKDAGRLLEFLKTPVTPELGIGMLDFSLTAVKAAEKLKDAISSLIANNLNKVLEDCAQIEKFEEDGDDKKRELLGLLLVSSTSGPVMLLTYELIDTLEEVLDAIDLAGDLVRILSIKAR